MVEEPVIYPYLKNSSWSEARTSPLFRRKAIVAIVIFTTIMMLLPYFFAVIEAREGVVLNDWLLQQIPARDCSITLFICLWSTSLLAMVRSFQHPGIFLRIIYLLIVITLTRVVTISLFPLEPPPGIIHLTDPLTSLTYGGRELFITKDLFFSGHTSNIFMICLCLQKKKDKLFALLTTIMIGTLVLVQHIHYTIDVIVAIIFAYALVQISKRVSFLNV
ncbi:MAG: phosphatase PAP2-related protein [Ferruginibacter sp.]